MATQISETARPSLTVLSDDEQLFRDSVYEFADREVDRKSTRLNSSHIQKSRMPSSA